MRARLQICSARARDTPMILAISPNESPPSDFSYERRRGFFAGISTILPQISAGRKRWQPKRSCCYLVDRTGSRWRWQRGRFKVIAARATPRATIPAPAIVAQITNALAGLAEPEAIRGHRQNADCHKLLNSIRGHRSHARRSRAPIR